MKKITEPGIYDISLAEYHGDPCDAPSISSSGLRDIEMKSPRHYWVTSPYNPNRIAREESRQMLLGSAAHHLLLGEDGFANRYVARLDEAPDGRAWNGNNKSCKEWLADQAAAGKIVLAPQEIAAIKGMAESLHEHPVIRAGILNGQVEKSLFWKDGDIWLKARPDAIPADSNIIVDLKTISCADAITTRRRITDAGYHMQLALAADGFRHVLGREMEEFVLVFVETAPPYCVNIKPIDKEAIWYGAMQNRRAIAKFRKAIKAGEWPGYEDDGITAHLQEWYRRRLEAEYENHELREAAE